MIKKITVALLLAAILLQSSLGMAQASAGVGDLVIKKGEQSDNVILLQLRLQDLGYYDYKITGFFGDFTVDALKDFQKENTLSDDGVAGSKTLTVLYSNDAKREPVQPIAKPKPSVSVSKSSRKYGAYVDWSIVDKLWKINVKCKVVDLDTKITYYMIRVNKSYTVGHADVAPATKKDTAAMKKTFGGDLNGYRRALVVYISGQAIAASLFGEPHGSTGVANNGLNMADGTLQQVCIHFKNSWTNGHGMVDPAHQWQVKRAANIKPTGSRPVLVYPGD